MKSIYTILLLFSMTILYGQSSDLLISEYGEGTSGNSKYVEIYNGTGASVNLGNYLLWKINNGGSWSEGEYTFTTTTLANDETLVIANNATDVPGADEYTNFATWTGNDAVALVKSGTIIDVIGEDGADPGAGWDVGATTNATQNHRLTRKDGICDPTNDWALSAGTDDLSSQWIVSSYTTGAANNGHTITCDLTFCGLSLSNEQISCDSETGGTDFVTYQIDFVDGNNGDNYVISTTQGVVGGDDPNSVAIGSITISNVPEQTNFTYTIENTSSSCSKNRTITGIPCSTGKDIVLVGVGDGNYSGGKPKFIELFVIHDTDLSNYQVEIFNDNTATPGHVYQLSSIKPSAINGERLFLVYEMAEFTSLFGCETFYNDTSHTYDSALVSFNGDDVVLVRNKTTNDVVDIFGVISEAGTTSPSWQYTNGWAYREDNFNPNPTYTPTEWIIMPNTFPISTTEDNCSLSDPYPFGLFVLPVDFLSVAATQQQGRVAIRWKTTVHDNLQGFDIQRLNENQVFTSIGEQGAIYTIQNTQEYSFVDTNPILGENLYRIIAKGYNGETKMSQVISVRIENQAEVYYLSQAKQILIQGKANAQIEVYNSMGQLVHVIDKSSNQESIATPNWSSGLYVIRIENKSYKVVVH